MSRPYERPRRKRSGGADPNPSKRETIANLRDEYADYRAAQAREILKNITKTIIEAEKYIDTFESNNFTPDLRKASRILFDAAESADDSQRLKGNTLSAFLKQ